MGFANGFNHLLRGYLCRKIRSNRYPKTKNSSIFFSFFLCIPGRRFSSDTLPRPELQLSTLSLDTKINSKDKRYSGSTRKKTFGLRGSDAIESAASKSVEGVERSPAKILKKKLNDVLQEGILDSVLPYLLPKQVQSENLQKKSSGNKAEIIILFLFIIIYFINDYDNMVYGCRYEKVRKEFYVQRQIRFKKKSYCQ